MPSFTKNCDRYENGKIEAQKFNWTLKYPHCDGSIINYQMMKKYVGVLKTTLLERRLSI